jgi:hypothetical protein
MPQQPVQIFMSYAWKDNTLPPDDPTAEKGFATLLWEQIDYEFDSADPKPVLWQDRNRIDDAQQFNPIIEQEIARSSLFLVVLSNHWLASEYCQKELRLFRERWRDEDDYTFGHRIIIVHKTFVPEERRPKIFPVQRGFQFFSVAADGTESPFHRRGKGTPQFFSMAGNLGQVLIKHTRHAAVVDEPPPPPALPPSGPKIYLAKPAPDMRAGYLRLHKELSDQKYHVVPSASAEIPLDTSAATKFIEDALADAKVSIHLLGKSGGHSPVDLPPIVQLQLALAEARIPEQIAEDPAAFRRIIWVPRVFEDPTGKVFERDSIETLGSFGRRLSNDCIEGSSLSPFIDFLLQHLPHALSAPPPPPPPPGNDQIYICHDEKDTAYAIELADLLEESKINYVMPVYYKTTEPERRQFHKANLAECSAVMMCWADASEMWVRAQSKELRDWRSLGRKQQFFCRGLVAGPPPDLRKDDKVLRHLFPAKDIDVLLNCTGEEKPSAETIRKIFAPDANAGR